MITAFVAIVVIAFVASIGLDRVGFSSEESSSASNVRLD